MAKTLTAFTLQSAFQFPLFQQEHQYDSDSSTGTAIRLVICSQHSFWCHGQPQSARKYARTASKSQNLETLLLQTGRHCSGSGGKKTRVAAQAPNTATECTCVARQPSVVLTREKGKNGKLMKALMARGLECLEMPLIEHREGPDRHRLPEVLRDEGFEWIVVTSPEAASVFLEGWREAGSPEVRLAVVGAGTAHVFDSCPPGERPSVAFTPSKATAKVLAAEIFRVEGGCGRVLYPASAKASSDLENGLRERGFAVLRLNTYSTESVVGVDPALLQSAARAPVATFASPTAVRAWMDLVVRGGDSWHGAAACIGGTSAEAARKAGLTKIYHPDSPGIDGWVESILEALEALKSQPAQNDGAKHAEGCTDG